tara:strand:+ start:7644 stop:8420 length:777 start_codon:yes stop_codon:yes gene_type:complete
MSIKFTILGCGYSMGVPRIDGFFGRCDPKNKKNYRTRCSALISSKNLNILIDTSPDLREQLIKNKVKSIDKIFYTHHHADQTHGINDLRVFYLKNKTKLNVYADDQTQKYLLKSFNYCFRNQGLSYPPIMNMLDLKDNHKFVDKKNNIELKSVVVKHGNINSICYIINKKCAYASDISKIYDYDIKLFFNLKYLIIDCLRYDPHYSHFNLKNVLDLVKVIKPEKTILTNLNHEMDYNQLKKKLPNNITPAFDGMTLLI